MLGYTSILMKNPQSRLGRTCLELVKISKQAKVYLVIDLYSYLYGITFLYEKLLCNNGTCCTSQLLFVEISIFRILKLLMQYLFCGFVENCKLKQLIEFFYVKYKLTFGNVQWDPSLLSGIALSKIYLVFQFKIPGKSSCFIGHILHRNLFQALNS